MSNEKLNNIFNIDDASDDEVDNAITQMTNSASNIVQKKPQNINVNITPENVDRIYSELGELVKSGKTILEAANYAISSTDAPDGEVMSAAASMINSLKDVLKEFNKINYSEILHNQKKEIAEIQIKAKRELQERKIEAMKEMLAMKNDNTINVTPNQIPMIEFSQEDIIKKLIEAEKKDVK